MLPRSSGHFHIIRGVSLSLFLGINSQEQHTRRYDSRTNDRKNHLRLPSTLHQRLSFRELGDGLDIVGQTTDQTSYAQQPEDDTQWQRHLEFDGCGPTLEMEGYNDGDGDYGEVNG